MRSLGALILAHTPFGEKRIETCRDLQRPAETCRDLQRPAETWAQLGSLGRGSPGPCPAAAAPCPRGPAAAAAPWPAWPGPAAGPARLELPEPSENRGGTTPSVQSGRAPRNKAAKPANAQSFSHKKEHRPRNLSLDFSVRSSQSSYAATLGLRLDAQPPGQPDPAPPHPWMQAAEAPWLAGCRPGKPPRRTTQWTTPKWT